MANVLRCADVIPTCDVEIEGRDRAEVMAAVIEHLRRDHGVRVPSFELVTRAHAAITPPAGRRGAAAGSNP